MSGGREDEEAQNRSYSKTHPTFPVREKQAVLHRFTIHKSLQCTQTLGLVSYSFAHINSVLLSNQLKEAFPNIVAKAGIYPTPEEESKTDWKSTYTKYFYRYYRIIIRVGAPKDAGDVSDAIYEAFPLTQLPPDATSMTG